jgi:hypothetical protein
MTNTKTFDVICSGKIKPGYDIQQVQENFASLLKISTEKAKTIVGTKRTLKKQLDANKANLYKQKLEDIGLVVTLKSNAVASGAGMTLALEPTEEELQQQQTNNLIPSAINSFNADPGLITCPKCGLEQTKTTECSGCGVIISKVLARGTESQAQDSEPFSTDSDKKSAPEQTINPVAIGAAAVAALLGAGLWMLIVIVFSYEHSLVALLVGSAVGFAAYTFGGRGQISGVICAGLTLIAIFAGKYYAYDHFQQNWASLFMEEFQDEGLEELFAQQFEIASFYEEEVNDDQSMRQFMVDYGYTESYEPDQIDAEDMAYFKDYVDPGLHSLANGATFEEWLQITVGAEMEDLSTWDLMKEDFGVLDIVFLFFGLGAAFRLGSGQHKTA